MSRKTIAVVGATGVQGGGLARAILAETDGEFAVRALTRRPDSKPAQELREQGAEVIHADVGDEASLLAAFQDAHGAYLMTNWSELMNPELEVAQARVMARAARAAGIKHAIWSTYEDTRATIPADDPRYPDVLDDYKVPHIDAKGSADAYFTGIGVPTTFLRTAFFWDNLASSLLPLKRAEDGTLALALAMGGSRLAGIFGEDIGRAALGIFKRGEEFIGQTVGIAGEHLTGAEMADQLTTALGEAVAYHPVPVESLRQSETDPPWLADDLANMFQFYIDYPDVMAAPRSVERTRELNPSLQSFAQWATQHRDAILAACSPPGRGPASAGPDQH